jgi:uncharacterized protein
MPSEEHIVNGLWLWRWVIAGLMLAASGCGGCGSSTGENQLQTLESLGQTSKMSLKGHEFAIWLALTDEQQQKGLMFVSEAEMQPTSEGLERGMLFVFGREQPRSFWMRNTIIPLDIAFMRSDGQIVKTHTMPPLTTQLFPSVEPARYALEVNAGVFQRLGITEGDVAEIPDSLLKAASQPSED